MIERGRRLYLIRHGRSDASSTTRTRTGRGDAWDPPLDEVGRDQAHLLARRLRAMPRPVAIYSSSLRRARETAHAFADPEGMRVGEREDLCEWFGGAWEAKAFEEIFRDHPEAMDLFRNQDPAWHLAPGGERAGDFRRRVVAAVEEIIAAHPQGDVFVVAHGGVINAYFAHILGIHDQEMFFLPENTSLNTVLIDGAKRRAWFLSDASHLTDPAWFAPVEPDGEAALYSARNPANEE